MSSEIPQAEVLSLGSAAPASKQNRTVCRKKRTFVIQQGVLLWRARVEAAASHRGEEGIHFLSSVRFNIDLLGRSACSETSSVNVPAESGHEHSG